MMPPLRRGVEWPGLRLKAWATAPSAECQEEEPVKKSPGHLTDESGVKK
jgi:hypothetical protein